MTPMKSNPAFLALLITLLSFSAPAQNLNTYKTQQRDSTQKKSQLRVGLRYTSDYYFMGRADSLAAPYLSPSISYFHKSGFFVHSSLSYLTSKGEQRVDLITLSGGYDYFGKKLALGASLTHYYFNSDSYVVQSVMTSYLNAYAAYDLNIFTIYTDVSLGISQSTDIFLGAEINRTFYAIRNHLLITPTLSMNAGSQKYYDEYYIYRSSKSGYGYGKGKGPGSGQSSTPTTQILESTSFNILDYEAAVQVAYKIGKTRFYVSSVWLMPVNPSTLITDQGTVTEELKNGFYYSTGVRFTF